MKQNIRVFLLAAAILISGLAIMPAHAQSSDLVTFSATGMDGSGNPAVSINGSFLIFVPPDSVQDSGNWNGVSDFSVTFTGLAGNPSATFTSANLSSILAPATAYNGPFYDFDYNSNPPMVLFSIEADGLDAANNYYGFDMQDEDGTSYTYGVDGTQYGGTLGSLSVNDPAGVPEPASMAVLGMGLCGLAAVRRRRVG